jgi:hypothetical protein
VYMFMGSWLSETWTSSMLAGKGLSAVPYLHIRDLVTLLRKVLDRIDSIRKSGVLLASPDGAVAHNQLFEAATLAYFGQRKKAILVPKMLCRSGIYLRRLFGNVSGHRPFESPWMCRYIDLQMTMDSSRTRELLDWKPRLRLEIVRRIPFMVENFRAEPAEWYHRNTAALKELPLVLHLKIQKMMKEHERDIQHAYTKRVFGLEGGEAFASYRNLPPSEQEWFRKQLFLQLMNSIRTRDKSLFRAYCQDLAEHRFQQGFTVQEVCDTLVVMNNVCLNVLGNAPANKELPPHALKDYITTTIQFGIDEVQEVFEQLGDGEYKPQSLELED